ncbi:MAG: DUF2974 domain-containing protein [Solobacterium sp.]|nr:DUF2974 domain-containing protein [Solobacterium sp.]
MSLSVKLLLLLNNLMYMDPSEGAFPDLASFSGKSVKDWIYSIDPAQIAERDPLHPAMTSASEWRDILKAARKERRLLDLRILRVYTDPSEDGGMCRNAVFISPDTADAIVVFKGTEMAVGSAQWKDNFLSGNTADTPHQKRALEWFQQTVEDCHLQQYEITVTGHSKGGNKAKYITILDDRIDRCVSFDGEGFSDLFFSKYGMEIVRNEHKIENHAVDYDYISLLLNDIGTCTFYRGHNYGTGGFAENHLANTFMRFDGHGNFIMEVNPEGRPAEMLAMDEFANSYLRSLEEAERFKALEMLNDLLNAVLSIERKMTQDEIAELFVQMAKGEDSRRHIAYMLAYIIRYEQKYPSVVPLLNRLFQRFGLDGLVQYVELVAGILNWKKRILWVSLSFDTITAAFRTMHAHAPGWVHRTLEDYMEKTGIHLQPESIVILADTIELTDGFLKTVTIYEDGTDRDVHPSVKREIHG